jgi:hypothetical protein
MPVVSSISTKVTNEVTPGAGNYASYVTVTGTGSIVPSVAGTVGVDLDGGSLANAGTADGGAGADAVSFGSVASTLIVDPGAAFNGNVVANGVNDTLELAGTTAGSFAGLGSQFTGFATVTEIAGASWTLNGTNNVTGDFDRCGRVCRDIVSALISGPSAD